jgi:hypothetical protein
MGRGKTYAARALKVRFGPTSGQVVTEGRRPPGINVEEVLKLLIDLIGDSKAELANPLVPLLFGVSQILPPQPVVRSGADRLIRKLTAA